MMTVNKKYRMKNWYWGNYMTKVATNTYRSVGRDSDINDSDMEEYIEEIHGWHHSDEYKQEQEDAKSKND